MEVSNDSIVNKSVNVKTENGEEDEAGEDNAKAGLFSDVFFIVNTKMYLSSLKDDNL